VQVWIIAKRRK